jgi:ssDNA-binding Zn-finger/Zn-ribbon topoisomerase 1
VFYGCGTFPTCNYALWDRPIPEPCPQCGGLMAVAGRGAPVTRCTECKYEVPALVSTPEAVSAG